MSNHKRNKTVLSHTALLLFAASLLLPHFAYAADSNKPFNLDYNITNLNYPNLPGSAGDDYGYSELFYKMLLAVFIVIVLGICAIYFSRKLLPKLSQLPGREIRIVETVHLGRQKALHLIKFANRKILIGSTTESITKLSEIIEDTGDNKITEEE